MTEENRLVNMIESEIAVSFLNDLRDDAAVTTQNKSTQQPYEEGDIDLFSQDNNLNDEDKVQIIRNEMNYLKSKQSHQQDIDGDEEEEEDRVFNSNIKQPDALVPIIDDITNNKNNGDDNDRDEIVYDKENSGSNDKKKNQNNNDREDNSKDDDDDDNDNICPLWRYKGNIRLIPLCCPYIVSEPLCIPYISLIFSTLYCLHLELDDHDKISKVVLHQYMYLVLCVMVKYQSKIIK